MKRISLFAVRLRAIYSFMPACARMNVGSYIDFEFCRRVAAVVFALNWIFDHFRRPVACVAAPLCDNKGKTKGNLITTLITDGLLLD